MPRDSKGNFHLNIQQAHAADRMRSPAAAKGSAAVPDAVQAPSEDTGMAHTTLHDHGDGSFHTESSDGERTEHPAIGHALMHLAAKHSDGKHMHVHHDGLEAVSHHVAEDGQVEGPHDHANIEALKDHLGKFFDEEENEPAYGANDDEDDDESSFSGLTA